eukprot:m.359142 g.359142  ORF g.359142 m.359142 type:complete len:298 (+) comp18437_c0_seq1:306-1199(+)
MSAEGDKANTQAVAKQPSHLKSFIAGGVGGVCLIIVGHPLDTIKVRMQNNPAKFPTMTTAISSLARSEGPLGFYKGVAAPLAGVAPMFALCFLGYSYGKSIFCDDDAMEKLKLGQIAMAGAFSAIFTTPIMAPGELAKCIIQVQDKANPKYNGAMHVLKEKFREGGLRAANRGWLVTLGRDSVASAFYFASYEYLKAKFTPEGESGPSVMGTLTAGGVAGMLNWGAALPIDVIKSQYQTNTNFKSYTEVVRSVYRAQGMKGFYSGMLPVMVRAFPANAAAFFGMEFAMKTLTKLGMD